MPISDGYEACKKIIKLFNSEKLFSYQAPIIQIEHDQPLIPKN